MRFLLSYFVALYLSLTPAMAETLRIHCGTPPKRSCEQVVNSGSFLFESEIKKNIEALYQGKILNPFAQAKDASPYLPSASFESPVCNLKAGERTAEKIQNHRNEPCGSICQFTCSQAKGSSQVTCNPRDTAAPCTAERSWLRGAFIQTILSKRDEVLNEIKTKNEIQLSDRCKPGAVPFKTALQDSSISPSTFEGFGFQVALCEVFARAENDWIKSNRVEYFRKIIHNTLSAAMESCDPPKSACINSAYAKSITQELERPSFKKASSRLIFDSETIFRCANKKGPVGWENLLCGSYPPSPLIPVQLGTLVNATESLKSTKEKSTKKP